MTSKMINWEHISVLFILIKSKTLSFDYFQILERFFVLLFCVFFDVHHFNITDQE